MVSEGAPSTALPPLALCLALAALVLPLGALAGLDARDLAVAPISLTLLGLLLAFRRRRDAGARRRVADAWIENGGARASSLFGWRGGPLMHAGAHAFPSAVPRDGRWPGRHGNARAAVLVAH